jgi:hypothetical protein
LADQAKMSMSDLIAIREMILSQGVNACFRALLESSGANGAVSAVKPYSKHSGMAIACNARERLGFIGNGIEEVALPFFWIAYALSNRNATLDIFENGAIVRLYDCPFKNGPPELCIALSHSMADGICENINPRFEHFYTHHLTKGDSRCQWIVREKKAKGEPFEIGEFIKRLPDLDLPEDEVTFLRSNGLGESWSLITDAFVNLHGQDRMLELVIRPMEEIGHSMGEWLQRNLNLNRKDLADAQLAVSSIYSAICHLSVIEPSPNLRLGLVSDCPFRHSPTGLCKQMEIIIDGACKTLDPRLVFSYTSRADRDSDVCSWVIEDEKEKGKSQVDPEMENAYANKALKALTLKYALGEIPRDEYDRMVRIIGARG